MKTVLSRMRSAIQKYDMIKEHDRIAVGISGGKDSMVLLAGLNRLKSFYPIQFEIVGVTLDPMFGGIETDYSDISRFCEDNSIEYVIKRTDIFQVASTTDDNSPCSLCAKLRRGILHNTAIELKCNSVALGHHLDDAAETFFMNLLDGGRVGCFSPKTYLSVKNLTLIRPMIFLYEKEIVRCKNKLELPVVKSKCPVDGHTERAKIKALVRDLEHKYPALRQKIIGAMQKDCVSDWNFTNQAKTVE